MTAREQPQDGLLSARHDRNGTVVVEWRTASGNERKATVFAATRSPTKPGEFHLAFSTPDGDSLSDFVVPRDVLMHLAQGSAALVAFDEARQDMAIGSKALAAIQEDPDAQNALLGALDSHPGNGQVAA